MRYACRSVRHVYQIRLDDQLFRALFCSPPADCCTLSSRSIIQSGISLSRFLLFQDKTEPITFFSFPIYAQEALRHLQVPAWCPRRHPQGGGQRARSIGFEQGGRRSPTSPPPAAAPAAAGQQQQGHAFEQGPTADIVRRLFMDSGRTQSRSSKSLRILTTPSRSKDSLHLERVFSKFTFQLSKSLEQTRGIHQEEVCPSWASASLILHSFHQSAH